MHKIFVKMLTVLLAFLLVATPLLAQEAEKTQNKTEQSDQLKSQKDSDSCLQGTIDGQRDGKGNGAYVLAGLGCGVFGFAFALLSKPSPNSLVLLEKSKTHSTEYMLCYKEAYTTKARNENVTSACIGWGAWVIFYIAMLSQSSSNQ